MTHNSTNNRNIERLYQLNPRKQSRHPYSKSKTESLASYKRAALQEYGRLIVNGTEANYIIQLNYLTELSVKDIKELWRQHANRLRRAGIVARVTIEITKYKRSQWATNKVHYHFIVKDNRTQDELQELFESVCQCSMNKTSFKVNVLPFKESKGGYRGYIGYFTKLRNKKGKKNYLFQRGLRLRKYFTINEKKWWTYPDGITPRTLTSVEKEMKRYKSIKERLEQSERFIRVQQRRTLTNRQANHAKLKALLGRHNDKVLYDWYSILMGKPTVFHTEPPDWLLYWLQSRPRKRKDLLDALETRLQNTDCLSVFYALQIYHRW